MNAVTLATVIGLAAFGALWAALSLVARALPLPAARSATAEARALFARAVFPSVFAALLVAALIVPSFLAHEPNRGDEWPGIVLLALAAFGTWRLLLVATRAAATVRASHALVFSWSRSARALPSQPWGAPASQIDAGYPVVAVAGLLRPHVFVDRRVLEVCSPAELAAVAAHERAHIGAFDNLRRLVVAACAGHESGAATAWRDALERAADERAVESPSTAADLAAALVRVARAARPAALPQAAISTIHDGGSLERRVRRLLTYSFDDRARHARRWPIALPALGLLAAALVVAPSTASLHAGLEWLVQRLP